jgi:exodeoxyribonuclease V alpha subunit
VSAQASPAAPAPSPVELVATLLEHRRTKPDSSWAVARFELAEVVAGGELIGRLQLGGTFAAVGGRLGLVAPGEGLRMRGSFETSPFGEQFKVEEQTAVGITSAVQASKWLERLDGVGPKRAARIAEHFGDRIKEVLDAVVPVGEPDPLTLIESISPMVARTIRESWGELGQSGSFEEVRYLDGLGLTRFQSNTVMDFCKKRKRAPQELLEAEPYLLVQARGFGFLTADKIAVAAGCSRLAPARMEAAAIYQAGELCDGDTMVLLGQLVGQTADLCKVDSALVLAGVVRLTAAGRLVQTKDEKGRSWVHPPDLVAAERSVFRLVRDDAIERERQAEADAAPLVRPAPEQVAVLQIAEDRRPAGLSSALTRALDGAVDFGGP